MPRRHGSAAGCVPKTAAAVGILSWHTTCCRLQGADAAAACTTAVESSIPRVISRWCWCCCPKIFKHVHHLCRLAGHLRLCGLFARGVSELFATAAHTAVRRIAPLAAASPLRRVVLRRQQPHPHRRVIATATGRRSQLRRLHCFHQRHSLVALRPWPHARHICGGSTWTDLNSGIFHTVSEEAMVEKIAAVCAQSRPSVLGGFIYLFAAACCLPP